MCFCGSLCLLLASHCSVNNGGCSHECVENEHGHHCECPEGLQLGYDRQTCDGKNIQKFLGANFRF